MGRYLHLQMLAARLIDRIIEFGHLVVIDARGVRHDFKRTDKPKVVVKLHDTSLHWKIALYPTMVVGDAYTNGSLTIEEGTLRDLLVIALKSMAAAERSPFNRRLNALKNWFYRREVVNKIGRAEVNVKHHYDLSAELYSLFLDPDRQYSCAYFRTPDDDLALAQLQKKQHLAAKLDLKPGQKVLDIGCGWGGLALYLAKTFGVRVTGLTLSQEQYDIAVRRSRAEGLTKLVEFKLLDYRQERGVYDRIVSVGMFEHVGEPHFREFFKQLSKLLQDDGFAVIHTIGKQCLPSPISVWIRRYIFPGAYLPTLSQLAPIFEDEDLWLTDFENLRLHYAETLKAWDVNFQNNRERVAEIYDEEFCRMWEFYLQSCEMGFRHSGLTVFQLQLAKQIDVVPMTREYMFEMEQELRDDVRSISEPTKIPAE